MPSAAGANMWKKVRLHDVRSLSLSVDGSPKRSARFSSTMLTKLGEEKERISTAADTLRTVPLFSELSNETLQLLAKSLTRTRVTLDEETGRWAYTPPLQGTPRGGVVIAQGDRGDAMFVVESGRLQAEVDVVRSVQNPEGVVKQYSTGDFFGELALVTEDPRGATVRCVDSCVLLSIDKKMVLDLLPGQMKELVSAHRRRTAMNVLQKVPLFSSLAQLQLEQLVGKLRRIEVVTGDDGTFDDIHQDDDDGTGRHFPGGVIINEGDRGSEMYVVESGRLQAEVEALKDPKDNPDGVVKEYGALEFFGELALVGNGSAKRAATVRCTDDSVLLELKRGDLPESIFGGDGSDGGIGAKQNSYQVTRTMLTYGGPDKYCLGAPGIVIHPQHPFCTCKDIVITCLILYSCTWEPFKAAFAEGDELNNFTDYIVDAIYWADIAINMITGVVEQNTVELDPKIIAKKYITSWFFVDVAATFPWDRVAAWTTETDTSANPGDATSSSGVQNLTLLRLLRLIRILRIIRMGRIVERLSNHFKIRSALIKILQLIIGLIIVVHLVACLFYMLSYLSASDAETCVIANGIKTCVVMASDDIDLTRYSSHTFKQPTECMNFANDTHEARGTMLSTWVCANGAGRDQGRSPGQAYLLATYFSITTVSTIGYGDISPELDNDTEVLFTLLVEFVGMFIFSYVVSNMAGLVANLNIKNKEFHERTDRYIEWMRDKETPDILRNRVLEYVNLVEASEFRKTEKDDELMAPLSVPLQVEMRQMIFHKKLATAFKHMKIFQGPPKDKDHEHWNPLYGTDWSPALESQKLLIEFTQELAVCVKSLIVMKGDLIVHRGEQASQEMFILLKGEVKLVGNDKNRARRISADSPYPFFGLAEILAKHDEVDVEQYEHRSAVAMKDCDLARVSRDDFDDMINKFPDVHTDLKAIAQASLDDASSMDRAVTKKQLQNAFDEVCKGAAGDERRISKLQLVDLLGSEKLECELAEPMLSRAVDMMDPIGAAENKNIAPSTPRIDFGHFYNWWTTSNFADPKGFLDSLSPLMSEPNDEEQSEQERDEKGYRMWVPRPTAHRVSLHQCEAMIKRGDGAEDKADKDETINMLANFVAHQQEAGHSLVSQNDANLSLTRYSTANVAPRLLTNAEDKEKEEEAKEEEEDHAASSVHPEVRKNRRRRASLDAGLGTNLLDDASLAAAVAANGASAKPAKGPKPGSLPAAAAATAAKAQPSIDKLSFELLEMSLAFGKRIEGLEDKMSRMEHVLNERFGSLEALLERAVADGDEDASRPSLPEADPPNSAISRGA